MLSVRTLPLDSARAAPAAGRRSRQRSRPVSFRAQRRPLGVGAPRGAGAGVRWTAAAPVPSARPRVAASGGLTRRGRAVLVTMVLSAVAAAFLLGRAASVGAGAATAPIAGSPRHAVVAPGDTLWRIAARVAPGRDPRATVADLVRLNHLGGARLVPGQWLQVPPAARR